MHGLASPSPAGSGFAVLRETVGELDPPEPAARARVIFRRQAFGIVETACGDVDLARGIDVLEGQLGAAPGAEAPHATNGAPLARPQIEQWQFVP